MPSSSILRELTGGGVPIGPVILLALVCTVLIMILVTPEKHRAGLNAFFRTLADLFNFKGLLVEHILKALYIFLTLASVFGGVLQFFRAPLAGLVLIVVTPILLRIIFELCMMFVILVKNVIQLNNKTPDSCGKCGDAGASAPLPPTADTSSDDQG